MRLLRATRGPSFAASSRCVSSRSSCCARRRSQARSRCGSARRGTSSGRKLGRGAWSETFEATQVGTKKKVAVKASRREDLREAFDKELDVARRARTASDAQKKRTTLLRVYGIGQHDDGRRALVMELAPASSIPAQARPQKEAVKIAMDAARGERSLELIGLRHNDIEPENAAYEGKTGAFRLLDLGNVVPLDQNSRLGGLHVPEEKYSVRTEVHQLGSLLYFARTGTKPGEDNPIDLSKVPEPALRAVIAKATEADPQKRYASAQQFLDALRPLR